MTDSNALSRGYRVLLWAYPRWHRRERGPEVLTTLLEAARPGQRHPAVRDALDLVLHGVRCRLRIPREPECQIIAAVVCWFCALIGAAAGGNLALSTFAAPPSEQRAAAIADLAMAQPPFYVDGPPHHCVDYCAFAWDPGGDQIEVLDQPTYRGGGLDYTTVVYWLPSTEHAAAIDAARQRLALAGWRIDPNARPVQPVGSPPVIGFTATRGHLVVRLSNEEVARRDNQPSDPPISLTLQIRPSPLALATITLAGSAGGLIGSRLILAWILQRHRRHGRRTRTAIALFGVPFLALAALTNALTLPVLVLWSLGASPVPLGPAAAMNILAGRTPDGIIHTTTALIISALLVIAAAATPSRSRPTDHPASPTHRQPT